MKKIKLLLPSLVLILFLSFSFLIKPSVKAAETLTDQQLVDRSLANINIRTEAIASFPVTYKSAFGATITWTSSDNDVIDAAKVAETNGWVIVHRDADEEKSATLTVTVILNDASATKSQEVTVPAGATITNTYNVTYNFGTLTDVTNTNPATHKAGDYKALADASKEGYTFKGWYSDAAYTDEMNCLPVGMYKDVTVYGKFEKIKTPVTVPTVENSYEFTYDGTEHKVNITVDEKIEVTYSENNTLTNVGEETVTVTFALKADYEADYVLSGNTTQTTTLKVNKSNITVEANDVSAEYGEDEKPLSYSVTSGSIVTGDDLTITPTKAAGTDVNEYAITLAATGADKDNYNITFTPGTYTITKATLTVTPTNITINKGATLPTIVQKEITGFKLTDSESILTGTLVYDFTGVDKETSGSYNFTISGYNDLTNYNIVYVNGLITVNDSTVTIEIAAEDLTTTYNGSVQKLDASKVSFKDNGTAVTIDNPTMTYTLNSTETDPKNAGTYVLTVSFNHSTYGTGSHTFNYVINKKDATITLNEQNHTYDGNVFTLAQDAYTTTGLVEADTIDGIVIKFVDASTEAKDAASYPITAEYTQNSNYNVNVVKSNLVISKATAVITAEDITVTYDGTTHSVTPTLNHGEVGLVCTDNSFTDVKYDAENNVTFYEVTVTAAATTNYTAAEKTVKVTINPVELTVTIADQTAVYSGTEPVVDQTKYSVTEGSKVGTDDLGITLTKAEGVNVNTDGYAITGTSSNGNYNVQFVNGTYSITKAPLTLVIDDKTIEKNDAFPEYTYSFTGFVNGETINTISELFIVVFRVLDDSDVAITTTETIGTYNIVATEDDYILDECNYDITKVTNGKLTIVKSNSEKVTEDATEITNTYDDVNTLNKMFLPTLVTTATNNSTIKWNSDTVGVSIDSTGKFVIDNDIVTGDTITVLLTAECTNSDAVAYSKGIKFIIGLTKGLTAENPYNVAEAIADVNKLTNNEFSSEKVYVSGIIKTVTYNTKYNNYEIEIVDSSDSSDIFKLYRATLAAELNAEDVVVGATITAYGYLQNYNGTPELSGDSSKDYPIIQSITLTNDIKLAAAKTQVETELNKYTSLTTAPTDKLIVNAKYGSTVTYTSNNSSVLSIGEDGTITINPSEENDTDVTVTYTISLDDSSLTGTKTITVKKSGTQEPTTVTKTMSALGWSNGTQYTSLAMDDNISITLSSGSNNGKYYNDGNEWRIYGSENGKITFTATEGYKILKIIINYNQKNNGVLISSDKSAQYSSGTEISVNASTITFGVGNTGNATNGQVKITSIEVVYEAA